jgi:hypothetical protein
LCRSGQFFLSHQFLNRPHWNPRKLSARLLMLYSLVTLRTADLLG